MSIDKTTYQLIANILSKTYSVSELVIDLKEYHHWEKLVKIGSEQLILPAIYWSLRTKHILNLVPKDLAKYLTDLYEINYNRNLSINSQIKNLSQLFEDHNINYCMLKGCAVMQFLSQHDIGLRMIGDIDILIDEVEIYKAQKLLISNGYNEGKSFSYEQKGYRHLNRLVNDNYIAAVELHSSILNKNNRHNISSKKILETSISKNKVVVSSKENLITTTILSTQINNKGHYYKSIDYRAILDCILLGITINQNLIEELTKKYETRSFIDVAQYFFNDFHSIKKSKTFLKSKRTIEFRFKYPQLFRIKLRIKWLFTNFIERIAIFLTNSSYRKHVFKNKIFPIFN